MKLHKALLAGLLVFCFITPAFAQHDAVESVNDFSKMLQSQISPYLLPKGSATEARNLRSNIEFGTLSKRFDMLEYGDVGSTAITSLHRYYLSDDTKHLIATTSSLIRVGNDDTGAFTTLRDQLTDGARWTWITYKDKAMGCDGIDRCQKWDGKITTTANTDGARSANLLTTDLGAPFAELNTGANLDASSWYQYKVAYYDGTNYSNSTAKSNPILTGAAVRDIALTDISTGPSGTTHRYIYRTLGGADRATVEADTTYYLVGTIANNTATTLSDDVTDATADDNAAPTWSTASGGSDITPPIGKFINLHKERVWIANKPSFKSYVFWSNVFRPDWFDSEDAEYIRPDAGDEITFIEPQLGVMIIGQRTTINKFLTQDTKDDNWVVEGVFSFVGCPAPYTASSSPLGIIYLSWDGLYVFNGEHSQLISDAVTEEINDILLSSITTSVGQYAHNEYHLAYTSEESGAGKNDVVLVLDTVRDSYALDDKSISAFEVFNAGDDFGTLYMGSSATDGKVYANTSSPTSLKLRYKTDLEAGTKDSVLITGTEKEPEMSIGWGVTFGSSTLQYVTFGATTYSASTMNRPETNGTWWSSVFDVSASDYEQLFWNETLSSAGDVTFAIRSNSTSFDADSSAIEWSDEFSNPSGSDVSGETANNFVQLRATMTTSDITLTPTIDSLNNFSIKLVYSKIGSSAETDILTLWESGWMNFGTPTELKRIWGIDVYYTSTSGTLNIQLENSEGDIDTNFDIDLSVDPVTDSGDRYEGNSTEKIFQWDAPLNSESDTPIGTDWKLTVAETGVVEWNVYKIDIRYSPEEYY